MRRGTTTVTISVFSELKSPDKHCRLALQAKFETPVAAAGLVSHFVSLILLGCFAPYFVCRNKEEKHFGPTIVPLTVPTKKKKPNQTQAVVHAIFPHRQILT
jgi:hypothetical protein